jgi:large repetitive protein
MRRLSVAFVVLVLSAGPGGTSAADEAPPTGSFSPAGSLTEARWGHTATVLSDGRVLVVGGAGRAFPRGGVARRPEATPPPMEVRTSAEIWDPTTGTFQATGSLAGPRAGHDALLLPDGRVLVIGGWAGDSWLPVASAEVWDPTTGTFTSAGSLATGRSGHTVTLLPDGRVLVVGGATAEIWDPVTGAFAPTGEMTVPRTGHTATLLPDGRVLIVGGSGSSARTGRTARAGRSAEIWSPDTGRFEPAGDLTADLTANDRIGHTATLLQDGRVAVMGGTDTGGPGPTEVEVWDPATDCFTPSGSLSGWRWGHEAVLLDDGRVLLVGGVTMTSRTEVWDPATGLATPAEPRTPEVQADTVTLLPDGRVLLAGGFAAGGDASLARAETWDPATDTLEPAGQMYQSRQDHTATMLPDGRVLVVGGREQRVAADPSDAYDRVLGSAEVWEPAIPSVE